MAEARNADGVRLFDRGRYHEALREFEEARHIDPDHPDGYYNMARTYHQMGVAEKSEEHLKRAEDLYNQCLDTGEFCAERYNYRDCYRGLAVLLAQQGREDKAFRLMEGWVDREPQNADAEIELARLHEEFNDLGAAETHLVEAVKIEPENFRALTALGKIAERKGDSRQALRNYQRSLQHNRFQPQVASRVTALQTLAGSPRPGTTPGSDTRLVEKDETTLR